MSEIISDDLKGRTAVVTGASRGIGRAIAIRLACAGTRVVLHAHTSRIAVESLADDIRRSGGEAVVQTADLSDPQQAESLVQRCWQWGGHVDIWVNNAGADVLTGDSAQMTFDQKLERLWQVDVRSTIQLGRAAGQRMKRRGGVILNMGWDQADTGMPGDSGEMFATAKGAIMAFTRSLAKSLAPHVRVNCLAPGWIQTQWGQHASAYWQTRAPQESLRARWGTPDDVARAALFLVSPHADFISGHVLPVDGGMTGYPTSTERSQPS